MGTFSRIRYVMAANLNALLEKAEDPEKLLRALIREMEDAGEDARLAVADLLAEQQHLERQTDRMDAEIGEWQDRAERAVEAGREELARAALKAKSELAEAREDARRQKQDLTARVARLEADMHTLKAKLADAKSRLKQMHAPNRPGSRPTPPEARLSRNERRLREAMGRFDRLQSQVERLEARVRSYEVGGVAPSPWAADASPRDPAIEAELEALKERVAGKTPKQGTANPAESEARSGEPTA